MAVFGVSRQRGYPFENVRSLAGIGWTVRGGSIYAFLVGDHYASAPQARRRSYR